MPTPASDERRLPSVPVPVRRLPLRHGAAALTAAALLLGSAALANPALAAEPVPAAPALSSSSPTDPAVPTGSGDPTAPVDPPAPLDPAPVDPAPPAEPTPAPPVTPTPPPAPPAPAPAPVKPVPATPAVSAKVAPVAGARLSSRFGARGFRWKSGRHTGLDFAARTGTPVKAARYGTVIRAGWSGRYGRAIVVRHPNGERTRYAHLSRIHAKVGQRVNAGHVIGRVGSTGNATGPHLHFEVMTKAGRFTDPYRWLRAK